MIRLVFLVIVAAGLQPNKSSAADNYGYSLMRSTVPYYCDDAYLLTSSVQGTETDCLNYCATYVHDDDGVRPSAPFNYALFSTDDNTTCKEGDKSKDCGSKQRNYSYWRYKVRWDPVIKKHGETWNLSLEEDDRRIHIKYIIHEEF